VPAEGPLREEIGGGRSAAGEAGRQVAVQVDAVGGVPVPMKPKVALLLAASEPL
jgi:hypothetical protein